jgi:hypothetical protein
MLTQKVFVNLTNHEAAERRAEHDLAKKRRVELFCFVYSIKKNHDRIHAIGKTWGLFLVMCSPPSKYNNAVMGGANLATLLFRALCKRDISLREVELAVEEEEDDDEEDEEEMERR